MWIAVAPRGHNRARAHGRKSRRGGPSRDSGRPTIGRWLCKLDVRHDRQGRAYLRVESSKVLTPRLAQDDLAVALRQHVFGRHQQVFGPWRSSPASEATGVRVFFRPSLRQVEVLHVSGPRPA